MDIVDVHADIVEICENLQNFTKSSNAQSKSQGVAWGSGKSSIFIDFPPWPGWAPPVWGRPPEREERRICPISRGSHWESPAYWAYHFPILSGGRPQTRGAHPHKRQSSHPSWGAMGIPLGIPCLLGILFPHPFWGAPPNRGRPPSQASVQPPLMGRHWG